MKFLKSTLEENQILSMGIFEVYLQLNIKDD